MKESLEFIQRWDIPPNTCSGDDPDLREGYEGYYGDYDWLQRVEENKPYPQPLD